MLDWDMQITWLVIGLFGGGPLWVIGTVALAYYLDDEVPEGDA